MKFFSFIRSKLNRESISIVDWDSQDLPFVGVLVLGLAVEETQEPITREPFIDFFIVCT